MQLTVCATLAIAIFGMAIEDVEGQTSMYSVAERDGLAQDVVGSQLLARFVPYPPFVHYQLGAPFGVELTHFLPVTLNHFVYANSSQQHLVPFRLVEVRSFQRRRPQVGIKMD